MAACLAPANDEELTQPEGSKLLSDVECDGDGDDNESPVVGQDPHRRDSAKRRGKGEYDMNRVSSMPTLAGHRSSAKFSFGTASRFPKTKSEGSPRVYSGQTSTTASEAGDVDDRYCASASSTVRHPPPPASDRLLAPRLDGSSMRLGDTKQKAAMPRAKSYDPAVSLGAGTSPTFNHAPHYSFGSGPSRVKCYDKVKEHLAHIPLNTGSQKHKGGKHTLPITMMDLKEATQPRRKSMPLSRGFGSQVRMKVKGGPMELPISPGPAAYAVPRSGDPEPVWATSSMNGRSCSWSKLSSERSKMINPTASDVGPGEYVLDHPDIPFKSASPAPIFGHPLREISKPVYLGQDPARYEQKGSVGESTVVDLVDGQRKTKQVARDAPKFSVGTGKRGEQFGPSGPGPAHYNPEDYNGMRLDGPSIAFTKSLRVHQSDLVDPDEPPGPGAHHVRVPKSTDRVSAKSGTLSKDAKMKHTAGLGPDGPGPGEAFRGSPPTTMNIAQKQQDHCTFGIPLPGQRVEDTPAVGEYHVQDHLVTPSSPSYGCMLRTGKRPPPWRVVEQPPVFELKSGEKLIMTNVPIQFQPSGPKYTMPPRRKDLKPDVRSDRMILTTSLG